MAITEKAPTVQTQTNTSPEEHPERAPIVLGWVVMMGVMAWAGAHPEESLPRIKEALGVYNTITEPMRKAENPDMRLAPIPHGIPPIATKIN